MSSPAPLRFERLEVPRYLSEAEQQFLIDGKTEFVFPVRRRTGDSDFYEKLDQELRSQDIMQVHSLREVKEGFTWISRPSALVLNLETLLRERPYLSVWRGEIESLSGTFTFINLREFLRMDRAEALRDLVLLRSCLEILSYLIHNRAQVVGLLPRQLPHGQSTKLIGRENLLLRIFSFWQGESARWSDFYFYFELLDKPLEFRFFAPSCRCQHHSMINLHGLLAQDWARDFEFSALKGTLIVENFESFLALTRESKSTLLVWGAGWRAFHLRHLLDHLPKPVYYWGDIDKEGYEIFAGLRSVAANLIPLLMNQSIVDRYRSIHQRKEIFLGPFRDIPELQSEYEFVSRNGIQIEQEQIREAWPFGTTLG